MSHSLQNYNIAKFENVFKIVNPDVIVYKKENYCTATYLQTCKVSNGIKIISFHNKAFFNQLTTSYTYIMIHCIYEQAVSFYLSLQL
jgi:hypothetical protein